MLVVDLPAKYDRVARADACARLRGVSKRIDLHAIDDNRIDRTQILASRPIVLGVQRERGAEPIKTSDIEVLVARVEQLQLLGVEV